MFYSHEYHSSLLSRVETAVPLFYIYGSEEVGVEPKLYVP